MKRIFYTLLLLLLTSSLFATIRTVCNVPDTLAQFSTIQAAITASTSGDTIYVHGSPNAYGAFTVDKRLVIIGPGWSPNKNLPLTAFINQGVNLSGASAAGSEIQGLHFQTTISVTTLGVNNIRFVRNRFTNLQINIFPNVVGTVSGYLFEGNWFDNAQVQTNNSYAMQDFIFQNNLFYENGTAVFGSVVGFTNSVNVLFNHNLFYGPGSNTRPVFVTNVRFITLSNNIFVRRNIGDLSSSSFSNNITFDAGTNDPWNVNGNVDVNNSNIANQDPQMAAQASVNAGINNPLLDFTIAAGPANNSGSDLKDMGLLYDPTGSLNWNNSRGSRLPYIFSMNITTPAVAPGGNVNVTVEARRNN